MPLRSVLPTANWQVSGVLSLSMTPGQTLLTGTKAVKTALEGLGGYMGGEDVRFVNGFVPHAAQLNFYW